MSGTAQPVPGVEKAKNIQRVMNGAVGSQPWTGPALGGSESPPCGLEKAGTGKVDLSALHNLGVTIAVKSRSGAKVLS